MKPSGTGDFVDTDGTVAHAYRDYIKQHGLLPHLYADETRQHAVDGNTKKVGIVRQKATYVQVPDSKYPLLRPHSFQPPYHRDTAREGAIRKRQQMLGSNPIFSSLFTFLNCWMYVDGILKKQAPLRQSMFLDS